MSFYFKIKKSKGLNEEQALEHFIKFGEDQKDTIILTTEETQENIKKEFEKSKVKNTITSNPESLIGGLDPKIYINPPKKFQENWIFYIPRCDFFPERYRELLPVKVDSYLPNSYGRLLPESYYYGVLKKINNKYYIDIDESKITDETNEKINEIYRVARDVNKFIPDDIYPKFFNIKEYNKCVKLLKDNPTKEWSSIISSEYHFIFGGTDSFNQLLVRI